MVRTDPDTFAVMLDPSGRVRFDFDERISETVADGDLDDAVTVSPVTGDVRVSHARRSLSVSLDGGFRPGLVYRVTLQPVVSDLFGNRMTQAFEVVFSTGGDAVSTATLAGEVWDRLSGRGLRGAMVRAVGPDSLVYLSRADDEGVFAFRYLPAGDFVLTGFQDTDRDRDVGAREARGSLPASLAAGDTLVIDVPVLEPDTTPAVPGAGRALDSVTIVVDFDDFLDPTASADQIGVRLTREGGATPLVARLFHERAYETYVDQVADSFARLDSTDAAARAAPAPAADTTADSLATPVPDSVAAAPPAPQRPRPPRLTGSTESQGAPPGRARPGRRIVGQLDGALEPGVEYQLRVTDVVNINGLPGGGGDATLVFEPPAPDTTSRDASPADSAAVADTLGVRP